MTTCLGNAIILSLQKRKLGLGKVMGISELHAYPKMQDLKLGCCDSNCWLPEHSGNVVPTQIIAAILPTSQKIGLGI